MENQTETNDEHIAEEAKPEQGTMAAQDATQADTFVKPDQYHFWSLCDHWPLRDSITLALADTPPVLGEQHEQIEKTTQWQQLYTLAINCANHSLPMLERETTPESYRVKPADFIRWTRKKHIELPQALIAQINTAQDRLPKEKKPRKLRPEQRHKERCRGIAALLWSQNKEITIARMVEAEVLIEIGCEGKTYKEETIRDWIKEECPNRTGGRRPNS